MPYESTDYITAKAKFRDLASQYKPAPASDQYLCEQLQQARLSLAHAQTQIVLRGWNTSHTALYEAVSDGIQAMTEATLALHDQPDF